MELKTKQMRNLLKPVQDQISKIILLYNKVPVNQSEITAVRTILLEQLHSLNERFKNLRSDDACEETDTKHNDVEATSKLTSVLQDISELIQVVTSGNTHGRINDKLQINYDLVSLINNFTLALRALEDLESLPLKQRLQDCLDYVKDMSMANEIEDLQNIKELGTSLLELLEPLQKYRKSLVSVSLSEKLALYNCQLCTSFEMLVKLAQEQHQLNAPIYTCKKYICERICTCCELILDLLNGSNPSQKEETTERENHFIYKMDLALDIILEMPSKSYEEQQTECEELWVRLESVFSHAMAITQVCQSYNFNAIIGSCQSIVMEYEKLKQQLLETPDSALNNLFMHTLTDALHRLERKVNIAVLTLALEVFSNPYAALKKLVMMCGSSLNAKRRSKSDLKTLIEDFDLLFDQTMQIGIYAIACCNDINRNNKIRTCLAGFESLETELISAITAFYLHPENKEMRSSVKLLTTQWQQEMNRFQNAVNLIINSAAFCEIVMDSLQERIKEISDCLDNREPVTQSQVQGIVQRASALSSQVTTVVNDIDAKSINRQTIMMIRELKAAIYEANIAAKTLLIDNATEPQQLRVIKRCELILNVVQRLQPALFALMNNTTHEKTARFQASPGHISAVSNVSNFPSTISGLPRDENSLVYIRTPYTVKTHKPQVSIQSANSIAQKPAALSDLIPYIRNGRALRLEQSIMYSSPLKNKNATESAAKTKEISRRNLSSIRQHLFSRDSFAVQTDISVSEESMELTAVLEKISCSSKSEDTTLPSYRSSKRDVQDSKCFESSISKVPQTTVSNTVEKSSETTKSETDSCLCKSVTLKVGECAISGGGDASLVMEMTKKLNSIQLSSNVQTSTLE